MKTQSKHSWVRRGFTLLELLIVVAIIGILMGLLASALYRAKMNAKRAQIRTDVRIIGSGIRAFRTEYGTWPWDSVKTGLVSFQKDNYKILEPMKGDAPSNPYHIQFLSWNELFTTNSTGERVPLGDYSETHAKCAVVDPWRTPYIIELDFSNDVGRVKCGTPYDVLKADPPVHTF